MIILHNTHLLKLLLNVPKTAARPQLLYEKYSPPSLWDLSVSKYTKRSMAINMEAVNEKFFLI